MRTVVALLALVFVRLASGAASAQQWRSFASREGRFTVDFPGTPTVAPPKPIQTAIGSVDMHMFEIDIPNVAFHAVTYTDYPPGTVADAHADSVLQGAKNGAVANVKGTLVDEKKIVVQGNKALDVKISAGQQTIFQRLVLVQSRLYQVIVVVPGVRTAAPPEVLHFMQSFVITH